eukprot:scaffold21733_cov18-Tisochrysis_lutea.AAC.1
MECETHPALQRIRSWARLPGGFAQIGAICGVSSAQARRFSLWPGAVPAHCDAELDLVLRLCVPAEYNHVVMLTIKCFDTCQCIVLSNYNGVCPSGALLCRASQGPSQLNLNTPSDSQQAFCAMLTFSAVQECVCELHEVHCRPLLGSSNGRPGVLQARHLLPRCIGPIQGIYFGPSRALVRTAAAVSDGVCVLQPAHSVLDRHVLVCGHLPGGIGSSAAVCRAEKG